MRPQKILTSKKKDGSNQRATFTVNGLLTQENINKLRPTSAKIDTIATNFTNNLIKQSNTALNEYQDLKGQKYKAMEKDLELAQAQIKFKIDAEKKKAQLEKDMQKEVAMQQNLIIIQKYEGSQQLLIEIQNNKIEMLSQDHEEFVKKLRQQHEQQHEEIVKFYEKQKKDQAYQYNLKEKQYEEQIEVLKKGSKLKLDSLIKSHENDLQKQKQQNKQKLSQKLNQQKKSLTDEKQQELEQQQKKLEKQKSEAIKYILDNIDNDMQTQIIQLKEQNEELQKEITSLQTQNATLSELIEKQQNQPKEQLCISTNTSSVFPLNSFSQEQEQQQQQQQQQLILLQEQIANEQQLHSEIVDSIYERTKSVIARKNEVLNNYKQMTVNLRNKVEEYEWVVQGLATANKGISERKQID